jgi:lactate permease
LPAAPDVAQAQQKKALPREEAMYQQVYDPVAHSLGLSAIFAAAPLTVMFIMLGGFKRSPQLSALVSLVVCLMVAVFVYAMPVGAALNSAVYGAVFSMLTVIWIIVTAIWLYNLAVESGHFAILRQSFASISGDQRIQGIIIAFCFGALLEALAGAGTPIAIVGAMLVALGFDPIKAVMMALVGDTAPVAFGALAVPIYTLSQVTGLPFDQLGSMVARQTAIVAVFLPMVLLLIVDGRRGVRECWLPAAVTGLSFGIVQFVTANYISIPIADVFAVLASAGAVVLLLRFWSPRTIVAAMPIESTVGAAQVMPAISPRETLRAYSPYIYVVVVFSLAQWGPIKALLAHGAVKFPWPGLAITDALGHAINTTYNFNYLPSSGTLLLLCGILTMFTLRVGPIAAVNCFGRTIYQLRWAIPTVLCVLGVAFVMNWSGQSATLGRFLAGAGALFALISPVIGWIGVVVTGSDNSTNALFGALQIAAAKATNLDGTLLAAANTAGGVLGKIISPQSLAVGAAAVGLVGREGEVFRRVLGWTLLLLAGLCLLVFLQSTSVLSWMVVGRPG